MISDTLSDAGASLDRYLNDPYYERFYGGPLLARIVKLRAEMAEIQGILDTPPDQLDENFNNIRIDWSGFPKRDWVVWCEDKKIGTVQAVVRADAMKEAQKNHPGLELVVLLLPMSEWDIYFDGRYVGSTYGTDAASVLQQARIGYHSPEKVSVRKKG